MLDSGLLSILPVDLCTHERLVAKGEGSSTDSRNFASTDCSVIHTSTTPTEGSDPRNMTQLATSPLQDIWLECCGVATSAYMPTPKDAFLIDWCGGDFHHHSSAHLTSARTHAHVSHKSRGFVSCTSRRGGLAAV